MTVRTSATGKKLAPEKENPWAKFSTTELERKLEELRKLIDGGMLTERSLDQQLTEVGIIECELAKRHGG